MDRYTPKERHLLLACFAAYTAAYISRSNLAPSLDAIARTFDVSAASVGLLSTLFALPYAAGQVATGLLADHLPAPRLILLGLLGAAAANLLFSFSASFALLLTLWFANGVFQSMIWTPIMRIFATHFRDSVRDRALFHISLTMIVGYLAAWLLSGLLTAWFSWRVAFRVSGLLTAAMAAASVLAMCRVDVQMHIRRTYVCGRVEWQTPLSILFLSTGLPLLLLCCVGNGYIRDGIANWATKLLMDSYAIDLNSTVGIVLIIPLVSFFGICLGQWVFKRTQGNVFIVAMILFAVSSVSCALLAVSYTNGILWCVVLLSVSSAMTYGLNPILTSLMPMLYRNMNRVSFVAGLMDAMIYIGSAFSGIGAGVLSSYYGWASVFGSWAFLSLAGTALLLAMRGHRTKEV